jgi:hypothetical protein
MIRHFKKYWAAYAVISLLLSVHLKLISNKYELVPKIVEDIVGGKVVEIKYFVASKSYLLLSMLSDASMAIAVALFVSLLFIRAIESEEKSLFEERLMTFQRDTAENAILSTFNHIVDKDFFEIIKQDVLNAPIIRRDLRWHYDIDFNKEVGCMTLTRTINYKLQNNSREQQKEQVYIGYFESLHSMTDFKSVKYRIEGDEDFANIEPENIGGNGLTTIKKEFIEIPGGKSAEIVYVLTQTFERNYIYETHFLNQGAVNLELTVNLPDTHEFSINCTVLHNRTEKIVDEITKKVYCIKGAIYRGQGIEFMCFPRCEALAERPEVESKKEHAV